MPEEKVRFLSWNMKDIKGPNPVDAANFLFQRIDQPGVRCLQEVSNEQLMELESRAHPHGFAIEHTIDKHRECKDKSTRDCYLVTLTNQSILRSNKWQISDTSKRRFETKIFIWIFRKMGLWDDTALFSGGLCTDIETAGESFRVINVHLSQTNWKIRLSEFATCLSRLSHSNPNVICGDFNILQGVWAFIFNVALGGFPLLCSFWGERKQFTHTFRLHRLLNPLSSMKTSKFGQLDHIVFSDYLFLNRANVHADKHGSDHNPVEVEILTLV